MAHIDTFAMERMQSLHWHEVEYDLSESGVTPLSVEELLGDGADPREFLHTALGYPLSEGSEATRERIASWYPGAGTENVTVVNGGSEANHLALWTLLEPGDRLAFMVPNYLQGLGLGRHYGEATDVFRLRMTGDRWMLDLDELDRAVTERTKVVMVCNPDNPTGHVLSDEEMTAVIEAAQRANAWLVADEVYRGAEVGVDESSPTFWGRYDKVIVSSGLSKAFAMPGLRIGWVVAPEETVREIWIRHDYTTLTPGMLSDLLATVAMEPARREQILARTRGIIRRQLPLLEEWINTHDDVFGYVPPDAGAIAYVECDLPVASADLAERIRTERSVLLVPGEMFGLGNGFRFGYGYDIEHTLKGLARVDEVLRTL
ncbi:MAG TPA: aminotransferase class I/II-fold pyridoxal phosphate-dependent enzyme [Actinomycetota bacterium]